jgi:hypothetical protein
MKSIIFWDGTPCILLSCNRRFGGTYSLHLRGRSNNFSKNQQVSRWQAQLFLWPWRWRRYVPPKRRVQLNRLHGVTSQKMITTLHNHCRENLKSYIMNVYFKKWRRHPFVQIYITSMVFIFIRSLKYINIFLIFYTKCARKFLYLFYSAPRTKKVSEPLI